MRRSSDEFMRRMTESFRVRVHRKRLRSGSQATTILVFRMTPCQGVEKRCLRP
jgi:hypothetical protein